MNMKMNIQMNQPSNKIIGFIDRCKVYCLKNKKQITTGLSLVFGLSFLGAAYWGYRQWAHAQSYKAFLSALKYYDAPVVAGISRDKDDEITFPDNQTKYKKVEELLISGFNSYKSTAVGCMFGIILSDLFITEGKNDQAIKVLSKAASYVPSQSLKEFYLLKLTLLKMDSEDEKNKKEGLESLKAMAENVNGYTHEASLYHLGFYYWNKKEYQDAQNYWRQLITRYGIKASGKQSGFADMAKQKLNLISTDFD